jgi:spore coat-associated protein N
MMLLRALKRNPKRRLGALAALFAAGAFAAGSGANFTATSANPSNTFSTGSLSMLNSKDGAAVLTAGAMRPGDSSTGTVDIQNTGSMSGAFTLSRSNISDSDSSNPLSAKLTVAVGDCGLWSGATPPSCASPTSIYSGTIAGMTGSRALGTFAASDKHRYQFVVTFPDGGAGGADNAYQGDNTSVQFDWSAV